MKNNKIIKMKYKDAKQRLAVEPSHEKFKKLSGLRVQRLIDTYKQIGNLSNKRYYKYSDAEKKFMLRQINEAHRELIRKWNDPAGNKPNPKRKKNFWEDTDI